MEIFKNIFAPYFCLNCFQINGCGYLCEKCLLDIDFSLGIFCIECNRRRPLNEDFLKTCCSTSLKSLISFANYENQVISKLIKLAKFSGYFETISFLSGLISNELMQIQNNLKDFYLVSIPLFKNTELKRGFNQAKIIAAVLNKNLEFPTSECLIKIKDNKPQRALEEKDRFENIKEVFKIKIKPPEKIILIDDIKTTGATLFEAARMLKNAGAKTIIGLTIVK